MAGSPTLSTHLPASASGQTAICAADPLLRRRRRWNATVAWPMPQLGPTKASLRWCSRRAVLPWLALALTARCASAPRGASERKRVSGSDFKESDSGGPSASSRVRLGPLETHQVVASIEAAETPLLAPIGATRVPRSSDILSDLTSAIWRASSQAHVGGMYTVANWLLGARLRPKRHLIGIVRRSGPSCHVFDRGCCMAGAIWENIHEGEHPPPEGSKLHDSPRRQHCTVVRIRLFLGGRRDSATACGRIGMSFIGRGFLECCLIRRVHAAK